MRAKKNPKADLNTYKLIFFQIGLIISLGIAYIGIEWSFGEVSGYSNQEIKVDMILTEAPPVTEFRTQIVPPLPPPPAPEILEIIDDDLKIEETIIKSNENRLDDPIQKVIQVDGIVDEKMEEKIEEVPFVLIADIPIYPGCENEIDNAAKKKCMSGKIQELLKHEFITNLGAKLGLKGINRIYVVFKIDYKGDVTDIHARGPHKVLEDEAMRVVRLIPKMTPGHQKNKPVNVTYSLPITFEVRTGF